MKAWRTTAWSARAFRSSSRPARTSARVTYDPSGTARAARTLQRGETYEVTSYELKPTPEELARSKPIYPPLISDRREYLEVDQGVSLPPFGTPGRWGVVNAMFGSYVRGRRIDPYRPLELLARRIAGSAKSPYAAAVALERWFRTGGGFVYNQHPPRVKAGVPALVDFVTRTREGYCQHFAGAMALMLRYLGIPSRVAAGFNSGSYDKHAGDWTVTDRDAHTWVEVWFRGWGWLPFDPTPSRGGAAGAYSSSSPQFDAAVAVAVLAGKDGLGSFAKHRSELGFAPRSTRGPDVLTPATIPATPSHGWRAPGIVGLLALVLAICIVVIALAKTVIRRSRYLTRDPRRLAVASAKELRDILRDQLVPVPESATFLELARLAEVELGVKAGSFGIHATVARFGPAASADRAADELRIDLRALRRGNPLAPDEARAAAWTAVATLARYGGHRMSDTFELFQQGRDHLRRGMAAQATVPLEKAKAREPEKASIREALGIAYFRIHRYARPSRSSERCSSSRRSTTTRTTRSAAASRSRAARPRRTATTSSRAPSARASTTTSRGSKTRHLKRVARRRRGGSPRARRLPRGRGARRPGAASSCLRARPPRGSRRSRPRAGAGSRRSWA